jgi:hypothetical protein
MVVVSRLPPRINRLAANCARQLIQNQLFDQGVRGILQINSTEGTVRHKRTQQGRA